MITLLATVFVFGVLIFIHEMGHFLAAKLFRIRVDRFSIGYPPRMVGKKIGETDYCISWIPFGGYVKIAGMVDESLDKERLKEDPKPWEYRSKPWVQRAVVVLAGPVMNIGFAFVIFAAATFIYGVPEQVPGTYVGNVVEEMPAEQAGIMPGDRITAIDDREVSSWEEMTEIIRGAPGRPLSIRWVRNDSTFMATMTPVAAESTSQDETQNMGQIGIWSKITIQRVGLGRAIVTGSETLYSFTKLVIVSIMKLITRKESIRSIGGPVLIAQLAGESARSGFGTLIGFMALISLNLGILNLLPIPVLDGGHMLFLGIEGVIRRSISVKVKMAIQQVFMFLLLGFMIFIIYQDILRVIQK